MDFFFTPHELAPLMPNPDLGLLLSIKTVFLLLGAA